MSVLLYVAHVIFWSPFVVRGTLQRLRAKAPSDVADSAAGNAATDAAVEPALPVPPSSDAAGIGSASAPSGAAASRDSVRAPHARLLLIGHTGAFGILYAGLGMTLGGTPAYLFESLPLVGALFIALGFATCTWTLATFRSWRLEAEVNAQHQLSTDGPFAWVRHPIYLSMGLLAVGTLFWVPTVLVVVGALLSLVGGDLRARAEEKILLTAFGDDYRQYMSRVKRFIPRLY